MSSNGRPDRRSRLRGAERGRWRRRAPGARRPRNCGTARPPGPTARPAGRHGTCRRLPRAQRAAAHTLRVIFRVRLPSSARAARRAAARSGRASLGFVSCTCGSQRAAGCRARTRAPGGRDVRRHRRGAGLTGGDAVAPTVRRPVGGAGLGVAAGPWRGQPRPRVALASPRVALASPRVALIHARARTPARRWAVARGRIGQFAVPPARGSLDVAGRRARHRRVAGAGWPCGSFRSGRTG
jgi:hypothetical protein